MYDYLTKENTDVFTSYKKTKQLGYSIGFSSPLSVCWDITSKCNAQCKFCFRELNKEELTLKQHRIILSKIIRSDVRKITFSGGEPLLLDHLPTLLEQAKQANLITSIVTNGILLEKQWDRIKDFVDWVTLPLDGSNDFIQEQMTRGNKHLERIIYLIGLMKKSDVKIKINTVIGNLNKNDLLNIAKIINTLGIQRWKIFQFLPLRGLAYRNERRFFISDEDFHNIVDDTLCYTKTLANIDVTIADRDYLSGNYFSIIQDGSIRVCKNNIDTIVGNLLFESIQDIWKSHLFDHEKHYFHRRWLLNNPIYVDTKEIQTIQLYQ